MIEEQQTGRDEAVEKQRPSRAEIVAKMQKRIADAETMRKARDAQLEAVEANQRYSAVGKSEAVEKINAAFLSESQTVGNDLEYLAREFDKACDAEQADVSSDQYRAAVDALSLGSEGLDVPGVREIIEPLSGNKATLRSLKSIAIRAGVPRSTVDIAFARYEYPEGFTGYVREAASNIRRGKSVDAVTSNAAIAIKEVSGKGRAYRTNWFF